MKREKTPFPAVPTNAAEASDDADWSIASSKKSAASSADAGEALALYTEALRGGRDRVPVGDDAREAEPRSCSSSSGRRRPSTTATRR